MDVNDVMHRKRVRGGFWGFWKSQWVELRTGHRTRRVVFRLLAEALGWLGWGRWKSQNRKNMYLSPYVEEPLNSNVIKSFVPELRSRYVFFVFRDSYVLSMYIYIWTLYVHFAYPYLVMVHLIELLAILGTIKLCWLMLNWIVLNRIVWS